MNLKKFFKNYYPALLVFVGLLSFTFYTHYEVTATLKARRERLFEQRVSRATEVLNKRIIDYIQILKGCQALFYASDSVTYDNWRTYIENLSLSENYPGIQAVGYAAYIHKSRVPELEKQVRRSGYTNFKVTSNFRNEYLTPIVYIEPFSGRNLRAFGFDMYSESIRNKAMYRALISGQPAMTRKVTLVQETNNNIQPGFILYLPLYKYPKATKTANDRKKNILGFVYNPFRAHDLMKAVLASFNDLDIKIYDGEEVTNESLLYSADLKTNTSTADDKLFSDTLLNTAGVRWRIVATTTERFGSAIEKEQPALVLIFGFAITFLIVVIAVNVINKRTMIVEELILTKAVEKKKDEFISIASHELKTPLTSIKAYIQLLERSDLKERERNFVHKSMLQIKKLNNLIADLLDVSKIQAGSLQLNSKIFSLRDLIYDSIETVEHMYSSHKIIISTEPPEVNINGDKFRLEQALTNLLVNAIKYSPAADKVYVAVKHINKKIAIEVKDDGIGISRESQKHVFEKYYRDKELSNALSGLGMGLFITNEIVKKHQGNITINSELGKGSVFTMYLPIAEKSSADLVGI